MYTAESVYSGSLALRMLEVCFWIFGLAGCLALVKSGNKIVNPPKLSPAGKHNGEIVAAVLFADV